MHATRKLWTWLAVICVLSFAALGWVGTEIYVSAPPIPKQVVSIKGQTLFAEGSVQRGQESVGAYVDDAAITTAVNARMVDNSNVDAASITPLPASPRNIGRTRPHRGAIRSVTHPPNGIITPPATCSSVANKALCSSGKRRISRK